MPRMTTFLSRLSFCESTAITSRNCCSSGELDASHCAFRQLFNAGREVNECAGCSGVVLALRFVADNAVVMNSDAESNAAQPCAPTEKQQCMDIRAKIVHTSSTFACLSARREHIGGVEQRSNGSWRACSTERFMTAATNWVAATAIRHGPFRRRKEEAPADLSKAREGAAKALRPASSARRI